VRPDGAPPPLSRRANLLSWFAPIKWTWSTFGCGMVRLELFRPCLGTALFRSCFGTGGVGRIEARRGETCPVSTEGGTRRVQLVREGGGGGGELRQGWGELRRGEARRVGQGRCHRERLRRRAARKGRRMPQRKWSSGRRHRHLGARGAIGRAPCRARASCGPPGECRFAQDLDPATLKPLLFVR
jgi:hypothetical protein